LSFNESFFIFVNVLKTLKMEQVELSVEMEVKSEVYTIKLNACENHLVIEIQNAETADNWKGTYEKKYIEELTRKTGNFKSFPIFVSMLKSALNQESSTVTLDLLTFSDLENLRNKSTLNQSTNSNVSRQSNQTKNNNKKYLIMTYNVEYDRINYPLQLRYQGKMEANDLLQIIKNLKNELKLQRQNLPSDFELRRELKRLENENNHLKKENESLELEIQQLTQTKMNGSQYSSTIDTKTHKEINSLKKMIKCIEEDAMKEKNTHLKQLIKKNEEINQLKIQMNRMIDNERNMVNKLKAIKDLEQSRSSKLNSRSSSKESVHRIPYHTTGHKSRLQSNSLDRFSKASSRLQSNSLDRFNSRASSTRKVSASPASSTRSRSKRFDPTEYCRMKKTRVEEINAQKKRELRSKMNISSDDCSSKVSYQSQRPRVPNRSRMMDSSIEQEYLNTSFALQPQATNHNLNNNINRTSKVSATRTYNRDQEMKEIDDKLKSLHNLIKYSL